LKINPNDLNALPALILAASQLDLDKAEQYDKKIPPLADEILIDVEALENLSSPARLGRQIEKAEKTDLTQHKNVEKKKKKKKKPKKIFDQKSPPADPERWLPLKERSGYKKKTKKGKLEKGGSQGSAPEKKSQEKTKPTEPSPTSPKSEIKEVNTSSTTNVPQTPTQNASKQPQPTPKKKPQKKKRH